uniref:PID domain-containing protein n=1 Tax=Plectus sambesii TaxID=2011161 RepID=A0A914UY39_9BILA
MTSVPKEVYKTIKRSLSATTNASGFGGTGGARYHGYSGSKQWIHPPDVLNHGRVEYSVKMLGQTEVAAAKGTEVIRDAIQKIRFGLQVNRSITGNSGAKLQKVDLQINVDGLTVADTKTKMVLFKYPLHRISFCADDKHDKRVFSFIAKADLVTRHDCFVFLSDKLAEEITLTIGEAFDLAYQKFLNNNGRELENKKQLILLRKRIAELEGENTNLKEQLAANNRHETNLAAVNRHETNVAAVDNHVTKPSWESLVTPTPQLPSTPMPTGPPPGLKPPPSRKTTNGENGSSLLAGGPLVGRKLENLQLDQMEDLFDDSFDPRASERVVKDPFGLDPFDTTFATDLVAGASRARTEHEPTPQDFEQMITMVDERLAEMRDGFKRGLSVGDTGDADLLGDLVPTMAGASSSSNGHLSSVANGH